MRAAGTELEPSGPVVDGELVDALPLRGGAHDVEPSRSGAPQLRTVAAVAATGFVAGAATAAVLGRQRGRRPAPRAPISSAWRRAERPPTRIVFVDVRIRSAPVPRV